MHCPDFSDIYNEDFNFDYVPKEIYGKAKETSQKEKTTNRGLCFPLKSEYFSKHLPTRSFASTRLPIFSKVKPRTYFKKHCTNSITSNEFDCNKEINKSKGSEKISYNTPNGNELNNFLKPADVKPFKSNYSSKSSAKKDEDDKFWDFLKTTKGSEKISYYTPNENELNNFLKPADVKLVKSNYSNKSSATKDEDDQFWDFLKTSSLSCDGKWNFEFLSDTELRKLRNLPPVTTSSGYYSGVSYTSDELHASRLSRSIPTPESLTNAPSYANSADDLCKNSSMLYYPSEKITNIRSEEYSDTISRNIIDEFEDFLKPIHKSTCTTLCPDLTTKEGEDYSGISHTNAEIYTSVLSRLIPTPEAHTNAVSNANSADDLCEKSSILSYHNEKLTNGRSKENSYVSNYVDEFEYFLKPSNNKSPSPKLSSNLTRESEDELMEILNLDSLLNPCCNCDNADKEDSFWDFLKTNTPVSGDAKYDLGSLTAAELEELRSLSSVVTSPVNAISGTYKDFHTSKVSSTVTSLTCANAQSQVVSPDEEIFKDLDLLLSEINSTTGEMQNQTEKVKETFANKDKKFSSNAQYGNNELCQKSNNIEPNVKLKNKRKKYDPKIINKNIPVAVFPSCPTSNPLQFSQPKTINKHQLQRFQQNTENISDNAKNVAKKDDINFPKQVTNAPYIFTNNSYVGVEKNTLKTNTIKVIESNSNDGSYPLVNISNADSETSLTNFRKSLNADSKCVKEGSTAVQLPVISSVFSIPSSIYEQCDISLAHKISTVSNELNASTSDPNTLVRDSNQNISISQKNDVNVDSTESNTVNFTSKHTSTHISPRKQKRGKRLLLRNSPRNSSVRIANSSFSNIQCASEKPTLKNSLNNNKRLKTSESKIGDNTIISGTSVSGTQAHLPEIQPKSDAVAHTSNATAPSSVPVYWIVSQNPQPAQNNNPGVLMVLSSDNQAMNNAAIKTPVSLTSSNFSVSATNTIPAVISTQVPNGNTQSISTVVQQIPFQTFSVTNVESASGSTEMSNCVKPNTLNSSKSQPVTYNTLKTQVLDNSEHSQVKLISTSLPQNLIQTNNANIYTIPIAMPNLSNISGNAHIGAPVTSHSSKTLYIQNANPQGNQPSLAETSKYYSLNAGQPKASNMSMSNGLFPVQYVNQLLQPKFRPIKSIPLGKDKNAIQQIRIPVKIADIKNALAANSFNNPVVSATVLNSQNLRTCDTVPKDINHVKPLNSATAQLQTENRVYDFIPYKPKIDSMLMKKNIAASGTEIINNNNFFKVQTLNSASLTTKPNVVQCNLTNASILGTQNVNSNGNTLSFNKISTKSSESSKPLTAGLQKSTLATLQELFPPPVSMIPVCVMQTVQSASKPAVTKVVVLQNTNSNGSETQISKNRNQRKLASNKMTKKIGRKTVRELLQEKNSSSAKVFRPQIATKILKPIYRLGSNGVLLPPDMSSLADKFPSINNSQHNVTGIRSNLTGNPSKRPNIMILPSAAKSALNIALSKEVSKKDSLSEFQDVELPQTSKPHNNETIKISSDILFDKMETSTEYRPRYYDMNELRIGYFKVEDDVDSNGRFRSKFKVLFKKSLFVYDFPITKCNQINVGNDYSHEDIVHIQVPFKTVLSMNMNNRNILIQVNKTPHVFMKSTEDDGAFICSLREKNKIAEAIMDSLQNSSIHKITLRKQQADHLKMNLCDFDSRFFALCNAGSSKNSLMDASPFEEEIATSNLKKVFQKNRRTVIRRLPQWDPDRMDDEPLELLNSDHLVSSNHVCSCRISCRSLRCSCVKAAKSCGTSGATCLCISCDNPLNILESFGISLEYSLNDSCLFQNIYQIPKLHDFLQRTVKLSCCNTVARVMDCIPGTVLCPNTECNAQLEFSWCGIVICYPERNPRNHCSFCGQCRFSNGRHCPICNKCYIITPKYPDCTHCRGYMMNPASLNGGHMDNAFPKSSIFQSSIKNSSKPEIIVLDGPFTTSNRVEATLPSTSTLPEGNHAVQKESEERMHEEDVDSKDVKNDTLSVLTEMLIHSCAGSELKVETCDELGACEYEKDGVEIMEEVKQEVKSGEDLKECYDILEEDSIKIEIPIESSAYAVTKIDISSP